MKKKILAACVALVWIMTCAALAQSEYARLGDENAVQAQDVAAWLEIPGAQFTMPVMQREVMEERVWRGCMMFRS